MNKIITMTTKGTFTLPIAVRRKLGINSKGDKLAIVLDEANQRVIISKPTDLSSIHKELKPYVQAKQPLLDVSGHYAARKPRI